MSTVVQIVSVLIKRGIRKFVTTPEVYLNNTCLRDTPLGCYRARSRTEHNIYCRKRLLVKKNQEASEQQKQLLQREAIGQDATQLCISRLRFKSNKCCALCVISCDSAVAAERSIFCHSLPLILIHEAQFNAT